MSAAGSPAGGPRRRQLLLVAGSGRSGTSLVTGLVARLGYAIPLPEVTADASNPKGFGEPRWAVDFHSQLLKRLKVAPEDGRPEAWEVVGRATGMPVVRDRLTRWLAEQLDISDRVVVKDPRLTWFVGLWSSVGAELGCDVSVLTMLRHPAESVRSRQLAYGAGSSPTTRTASWLNMMLGLEGGTRDQRRAVVSYDELLSDWQAALRAAEPGLGMQLVSGRREHELDLAGELVDTSLRRAQADWQALELPAPVQQLAQRAYAALGDLVAGQQHPPVELLDGLLGEYTSLYEWAAELTRSRVRAARMEERRKADEVSAGRSTP